jgi:hypothetical protein
MKTVERHQPETCTVSEASVGINGSLTRSYIDELLLDDIHKLAYLFSWTCPEDQAVPRIHIFWGLFLINELLQYRV